MFGEWRVQVLDEPGFGGYKVYMFRRMPDRKTEFLKKDGTIVQRDPGSANGDDYFALMEDEQIQSLADALAEKGIKNRNDHKAEGLLEATNKHLEDMRKLVFKERK